MLQTVLFFTALGTTVLGLVALAATVLTRRGGGASSKPPTPLHGLAHLLWHVALAVLALAAAFWLAWLLFPAPG